jgi:hypothetical protein
LDMNHLGIPGHYLVYSGAQDWIGMIAMIDGCAASFRYPVEPLSELYNRL